MEEEDWSKRRTEFAVDVARRLFDRDVPLETLPGEPDGAASLRAQMFAQAYADSWSRPALGADVKSFVTTAILASMGSYEEMKTHVAAGLHLGNTPEQYVELFSHIAAYCGTSRAVPGWNAASEVIRKVTLSRERRARSGD